MTSLQRRIASVRGWIIGGLVFLGFMAHQMGRFAPTALGTEIGLAVAAVWAILGFYLGSLPIALPSGKLWDGLKIPRAATLAIIFFCAGWEFTVEGIFDYTGSDYRVSHYPIFTLTGWRSESTLWSAAPILDGHFFDTVIPMPPPWYHLHVGSPVYLYGPTSALGTHVVVNSDHPLVH